jgi:hypothetical protein
MSYAHYFALERSIKELGFDVERSELIEQFTDGQKKSLKELSADEYTRFTTWLHTTFIQGGSRSDGRSTHSTAANSKYGPLNVMRRKLLALFFKMGYQKNGKSNVQAVDAWCRKYGKFHKGLNEMDGAELPAVITQAEAMYQTFLEGL